MSRAELTFYKMSGAGNDFIIIDGMDKNIMAQLHQLPLSRDELARRACRRGTGVGADGLVVVEPPRSAAHFRWDFYNADGSSAEMCGNAARCVASLMFQKGYVPTKMSFETSAGIINAEFRPDKTISVKMASKDFALEEQRLAIDGQTVLGYRINTGVPHFVIELPIKEKEKMKNVIRKIRNHPEFGAAGTNVTIYEPKSANMIESVSFERGVEDFTLACGTGAVSAALVFSKKTGSTLQEKEVQVHVPGGRLFVSRDIASGRPLLRGPAVIVYIGHLNIGALV